MISSSSLRIYGYEYLNVYDYFRVPDHQISVGGWTFHENLKNFIDLKLA